nr:Unknown Function [uncultured bacterium]
MDHPFEAPQEIRPPKKASTAMQRKRLEQAGEVLLYAGKNAGNLKEGGGESDSQILTREKVKSTLVQQVSFDDPILSATLDTIVETTAATWGNLDQKSFERSVNSKRRELDLAVKEYLRAIRNTTSERNKMVKKAQTNIESLFQ